MSAENILKDALSETGISLKVSKDELIRYIAERATHLATIPIESKGYLRALRAERNAVALFAGLNATLQAEAAEARIVGVIQGLLVAAL